MSVLAVDDEPRGYVTVLREIGLERKVHTSSLLWVPWPAQVMALVASARAGKLDEKTATRPPREQAAAIWHKIVESEDLGLEADWDVML